jgi:hypothetical protein
VAILFALCFSLNQGCARQELSHRAAADSSPSEQKLPFHPDTYPDSGSARVRPAISPDPKLGGVPFRAGALPRVLPAGTLLTVRLERSISSTAVHAGDVFTASVTAPLMIEGDTLIESGTAVTGRVESAQSQADFPVGVRGSGYFQLTLITITVDGRQLALQTSSLFARGTAEPLNAPSPGNSPQQRAQGVQVQKARPLTFRLTAPVTLDAPNSVADRQSPGPVPE